MERMVAVLEEAFAPVDGYAVAREERTRLRKAGQFEKTEALQYGEIDFGGFLKVLEATSPQKGDTFADIGSGTGKAVLLAAACYPLGKAVGIEIVEPLHELAVDAKRSLYSKLVDGLKPKTPADKCSLVCGDSFALTDRWVDADILYAPCTCFTDDMMARLLALVPRLKDGARVVSTSRPLESPALALQTSMRAKYKRGNLKFFVYKRITAAGGEKQQQQQQQDKEEGEEQSDMVAREKEGSKEENEEEERGEERGEHSAKRDAKHQQPDALDQNGDGSQPTTKRPKVAAQDEA